MTKPILHLLADPFDIDGMIAAFKAATGRQPSEADDAETRQLLAEGKEIAIAAQVAEDGADAAQTPGGD